MVDRANPDGERTVDNWTRQGFNYIFSRIITILDRHNWYGGYFNDGDCGNMMLTSAGQEDQYRKGSIT